jgi:hypothetical protein
VKAAFGVFVALLLLGTAPAMASTSGSNAGMHATSILPQTAPSPSPSLTSTASPSPGAAEDQGGIATGAGIVIAAILIGGLFLMRSRLLRR